MPSDAPYVLNKQREILDIAGREEIPPGPVPDVELDIGGSVFGIDAETVLVLDA